jgi:uncharacterized membrane protein YsdA (DUF1294 family)
MSTNPSSSRSKARPRRSVDGFALIALLHLLVLPVYVLTRQMGWVDWRLLISVPLALSLIAFWVMRSDKRRAELEMWRIPEITLHFLELIGGWPGSFLAQRMFRHKTAKISYQLVFWLIVAGYQYAAVDFLLDWQFSRDAWFYLQTHLG